jgi:G3E family GTPase
MIKVDIVSGFLGAGKTTFIKKIVQDIYPQEKVVVLENEFGKINIDKETLLRSDIQVKAIQASCICCTGAGDLSKGIYEIIKEYKPDRIIIEPTGIAKLSDVKKTVQALDNDTACELDHSITIVDARNYHKRILVSKEFFENQLRSSEVIFLSKTDQLEQDEINNVVNEIYKVQGHSLIVSEPWDRIRPDLLKELIDYQKPANNLKQPMRIIHYPHCDFESFEIVMEEKLNQNEIKKFISEIELGLYGEVHRAKGICNDSHNDWYSMEYVPGELKLTPLQQEKVKLDKTSICIIGRNLERDRLNECFHLQ